MSIRSKHVCVFLLKSWLPRINNNLDYRYNHSDVAIAWLPRLTIPEIAFALCHNWFLRGRYSLIARDSIFGRLFTRSFFRVLATNLQQLLNQRFRLFGWDAGIAKGQRTFPRVQDGLQLFQRR
jgi:hypothetical protein